MSVIPAKINLVLYEGSTFDETWTFYQDEDQTLPEDFTGYTAALKVRKNFDGAALLSLTNGTPSSSQSAIELGGDAGTVRIYITDDDLANLNAADFTETLDAEGNGTGEYTGVYDLELTLSGETHRYVMGSVRFDREATY